MIPSQLPQTRVWVHNMYLSCELERIQPILQSEGIDCCDCPKENTTSAIVLFGESTPWEELMRFIDNCCKSDQLVIAIGMIHQSIELAKIWELLDQGAEEVLSWYHTPHPEKVISTRLARWSYIESRVHSATIKEKLIGSSKPWIKLLRQVIEIACFSKSSVLIQGESGTGKELIARLIHDLDARQNKKDYVILDCSTIVPELSGSEFFGHEKGAFTSAIANRDGAFALANDGTLFLDEIGELPLNLQAELLRVVQEGSYKRVGSNNWRNTNFRLISATNHLLREDVKNGAFREDLYYRISTCVCCIPPLRERRGDIAALSMHFVKEIINTTELPSFDENVLHYLISRDYPGNVRELRQLISRILTRHPENNNLITIGDIPQEDRQTLHVSQNSWKENGFADSIRQALAYGVCLKDIKRIASEVAMNIAIEESGGNLQDAAARLDVSDRLVQGFWAERKNGKHLVEG